MNELTLLSTPVMINFIYATTGTFIAIVFMILSFWLIDKITPYQTANELKKGNMAVGLVVSFSFVAIAIVVGLVIGLGLN